MPKSGIQVANHSRFLIPLLLCACFFDRDGELVGKTGHLGFGDGADGEADAFLQRYHEDMLLFQIVADRLGLGDR